MNPFLPLHGGWVAPDVRRRLRLAAQQPVHIDVRFESRPCFLGVPAQHDATTSGRVILRRQLTFESRPEERVQQLQVWRSWRLEDDVPSRE